MSHKANLTARKRAAPWSVGWNRCLAVVAPCIPFALLCLVSYSTIAGDEPKRTAQETAPEVAAAKFLSAVVDSLRLKRVDSAEGDVMRPQPTPLLKYSDPARGYLGAGIWRVGESARPQALVALEHRRRDKDARFALGYELISLTPRKLQLTSEIQPIALATDGSSAEFVPLSDAPTPVESERQRLVQMRSLARRFAATEHYKGETYTLRLIPQPIDRYQDTAAKILDGAVFIFAYGTNPELVLFLECEDRIWRYAVARLSSAEVVVELDGQEVARFAESRELIVQGPYVTGGHVIDEP